MGNLWVLKISLRHQERREKPIQAGQTQQNERTSKSSSTFKVTFLLLFLLAESTLSTKQIKRDNKIQSVPMKVRWFIHSPSSIKSCKQTLEVSGEFVRWAANMNIRISTNQEFIIFCENVRKKLVELYFGGR